MTRGSPSRSVESRDRWTAQIAALDESPEASRSRKAPLTVEGIVEAAFELVEAEGFDALTMRHVATALRTGPASLYAHVRNKAELDGLLIGELCAHVALPVPDPKKWRAQVADVCTQLRDQFLHYPGVSRVALTATPNNVDTLRISEGMLAILLAGGVPPQSAAWAIDAAYLYVSAYCLETSLRRTSDRDVDDRTLEREDTIERFRMLPEAIFPNTIAYARELTAGDGHERFDFTLGLLFQGLTPLSPAPRRRTSK